MTTNPTSDGLQIIREKDRFRLTSISRVHWWRLERMNRVPKRIRLGENSVGWLRGEIEGWIKRKAAGR